MADFVGWIKGLGLVSALSFPPIESGLNQCQCVLTYRRVDDDEIQDAVQELYGYRQMSYVNVEAKEGEGDHDSGTVTDMKAWVLIRRRVDGSARLFFHDYDKPRYSDIQARYQDESSDDDFGDEESAAAHPVLTELSSTARTSTQTEDWPGEEARLEPTSTGYTTAPAATSSLLTSMAQLSISPVHVDNLAAGPHVGEGREPHATLQLASIEGKHQKDVVAGAPPNAHSLDSTPELARTETTHNEDTMAGALTCMPAVYSKLEPTSIEGARTEDATMKEAAAGVHTNAPAVYSTPGCASIENTHTEDAAATADVNLPRAHSTDELARTECTHSEDAVTCAPATQSTGDPLKIEHAEDGAEDTPTTHSTAKLGLTGAEYRGEAMVEDTTSTNTPGLCSTLELPRIEVAHSEDATMQDGAAGVLTCAPAIHRTYEVVRGERADTGDVEMEDTATARHNEQETAQPAPTEHTEGAAEDMPTKRTTAEGAYTDHTEMEDRGTLLSAPTVLLTHEHAESEGSYSDDAAMEDTAAGMLTCTPATTHEFTEGGARECVRTGEAAMDNTAAA